MKTILSLFAFGFVLVQAATAQDFTLKRCDYEVPEQGTRVAYSFVSEDWRYTFSPPRQECSINADAADRKITFQPRDSKFQLTFQITTNSPGALPSQEALKERVAEMYPEGKIFQVLPVATGMGSGLAFDVARIPAAGKHLTTRVAFVPFRDGTMVVAFTTPTEIFNGSTRIVSGFLGGLSWQPADQRTVSLR